MRKICGLFILLGVLAVSSQAQITGISGSKISAFCTTVVGHHKIEFEPGFTVQGTKQYWDNNGDIQSSFGSSDSLEIQTSSYLRFSFGFNDKLEVGMALSTDLTYNNFASRYIFHQGEQSEWALMAGLYVPFGNRTIDRNQKSDDDLIASAFGVVFSHFVDDKLSVDLNAQYQSYHGKRSDGHKVDYFVNADLGYFINPKWQIIAGLGQQISVFDGANQGKLTFYPGFSIEPGNQFLVVLNGNFDVAGKGQQRFNGFNFALTILFE